MEVRGGGGGFISSIVAACTILFLFAADTILAALTPLAIVVAVCGLCTALRRLFETQSIRFYKSNKNWSDDVAFCRRSGLVKSFQGNFPFYEFDAFIEMSADMKGNQYHTLKVRHRYPQFSKDKCSGLPLEFTFPTDTGSIAERYAMWDMLSRYMDVSQPL
ncbi:hypothetical protein SAMN05443545_1161, partial [Aidingimonas halophila]